MRRPYGAFERSARDNDVFVVLGPFNEHLMAEVNRPTYRMIHAEIAAWLAGNQIPHFLPEPLPSVLYADASHPLTEGYQLLARSLYSDAAFQNWMNAK